MSLSLGVPLNIENIEFNDVTEIPPYSEIKHGELFNLSLSVNTTDLTHGLHRFAGKYIPQIPRWAIREFSKDGDTIVDPFMGSGTTLVEGLTFNRKCIGIDIDPLARLISSAKTGCPSSERILFLGKEIKDCWNSTTDELIIPMDGVPNFIHWFTPKVWNHLQSLMNIIDNIICTNNEKNFLLIVFSSILRNVSNADNQSHKTYVSGTNPKSVPDVNSTFWKAFNRAVKGLVRLELAKNVNAKSIIKNEADATNTMLDSNSTDLIITSPPYVDSIDYMYNLMTEYFWLGKKLNVPNRSVFNTFRKLHIGTKAPKVNSLIPIEVEHLFIPLGLTNERHKSISAYLLEMKKHMIEASRILKNEAYYIMVLGNSQTKTGILPIHDCIVTFANQNGLTLRKAFGYRIRRHHMKFPRGGKGGIILIDWILVFQKKDTAKNNSSRLPLPWGILQKNQVAH